MSQGWDIELATESSLEGRIFPKTTCIPLHRGGFDVKKMNIIVRFRLQIEMWVCLNIHGS